MTLELKGRAAVITGAAGGIGRALALRAAAEGMPVALADIDAVALEAVAREVRAAGADVLALSVDVRERAQLDAFAARSFARFSSVALVFVNAGVMRAATSWQQAPADWELTVDVNLKGAGHTASAFIPRLLEQNAPAQVIFTGSTSAFLPRPQLSAYSCTKHALWGLAEAMQLELRALSAPVGVSFLAPAGVRTEIANRHCAGEEQTMQQTVHAMLEAYGMPPEELAAKTFAAVREQQFWILPHPEFKSALLERAARIEAETDPA